MFSDKMPSHLQLVQDPYIWTAVKLVVSSQLANSLEPLHASSHLHDSYSLLPCTTDSRSSTTAWTTVVANYLAQKDLRHGCNVIRVYY